jgi:hypothetical protein
MTTLKHKSLLTKMYQIHKHIETLLFGNDEINIRKHSMIFNNWSLLCKVYLSFKSFSYVYPEVMNTSLGNIEYWLNIYCFYCVTIILSFRYFFFPFPFIFYLVSRLHCCRKFSTSTSIPWRFFNLMDIAI